MTNCRFVAGDQPRVIKGRHTAPCSCDGEFGCLPCPETHCLVCGKEHARAACVTCLEAARSDLHAIRDLCLGLPEEAAQKGVQSEAMMLLGPIADPEAWQFVAISAVMGRVDSAYLDDCRDEKHPLWVLGTWEQMWREHLDHQVPLSAVSIESAGGYLDMQIGYMADQAEPPFDEFARDLRQCRAHLEDVLRDGVREERGAPCVQCEKPMVRAGDHWECRTCHRTVTEDQYRYAVGVAYLAHSDRLTASEMSEKLGIKASLVRLWGSRGLVTKRGRNQDGILMYDVAEVEAKMDLCGEAG